MKKLFLATVTMLFLAVWADADEIGIAYKRDLYGYLSKPCELKEDSPVVLLIHGGGWSGMSHKNVAGIADFFVREGCVVFNIDYRLCKDNPWPACGDDCLSAARFVLRGGLEKYGVKPEKLWIAGASAGGHLALWTGLSLPAGEVDGIISISGIGDPLPDSERNPSRYATLFGGHNPDVKNFDSMNPCLMIRKGGPRILLTHAKEDTVVPEASSKNFYLAYTAAGNPVSYRQYSSGDEPNTGGHCIWRKGIPKGQPKQLIELLENEITHFMKLGLGVDTYSYTGKDFARMFDSDGRVVSILKAGPIFSKVSYLERHMLSDELFVLMKGSAKMYLGSGIAPIDLEQGKFYNVRRGTWHQIEVSDDAEVLVVENSGDIGTEKKDL